MATRRQLRCVIAAGGTAGHVLSALAVAEALTERDVFVTVAGSPDRVEARLVPDAGYELDTFRIEGIPRQPPAILIAAQAKRVYAEITAATPTNPSSSPMFASIMSVCASGR